MSVTRFGISLENTLLERFDGLISKKGYPSRSEAIRDLIRDSLVTEEWETYTTETVGTITLVYSHDIKELTDNLTDIQHDYHQAIVSAMHIHLDDHNCLEVIIVRGKAKQVKNLSQKMFALRGVKNGHLATSSTGGHLE